MKLFLAIILSIFATSAVAKDCKELALETQGYKDNLALLELFYPETSWFQRAVAKYSLDLEVEAFCEVKENKERKSLYWSLQKDKEYLELALEVYSLKGNK
jgi:hypothetical protein